MSGKKTWFIIGGAAVLVASGVAGYVYLKYSPAEVSTAIGGAKFVPDAALMSAFVSNDTQVWSKLQNFGTPEAQKLVSQQLKQLQENFLAKNNLDFEKDLQSWVGGVTIAVLPKEKSLNSPDDRSSVNPPEAAKNSEPKVMLVVGIKDKLNAINFASKIKSQAKNENNKSNDYQGVSINFNGEKTYSALVGDYVVLSAQKQVIEQAIDTFQGKEPTLANQAEIYLKQNPQFKNSLATAFIPDYAALVQELASNSQDKSPISSANLNQLKQIKSVFMGIAVDNNGLRLQATAKINPETLRLNQTPSPGKVVNLFPPQTLALISGNGINQLWSNLLEQSQKYPELKTRIEGIKQGMKTANLDADKDVFPWMNGEFAISAIASEQVLPYNFGGVLVLETSDRPGAENTLKKLDDFAKKNTLNVETRTIADKTITEWKIPFQGALLGHGWLNENSMFVAIGGSPLADLMVTKSNNSLGNSDSFKAIAGSLPNPNQGYFYFDVDQTMSLVNRKVSQIPGSQLPPDFNAIANSIQGIAITTNWLDSSTSQLQMFLALKPTTKK